MKDEKFIESAREYSENFAESASPELTKLMRGFYRLEKSNLESNKLSFFYSAMLIWGNFTHDIIIDICGNTNNKDITDIIGKFIEYLEFKKKKFIEMNKNFDENQKEIIKSLKEGKLSEAIKKAVAANGIVTDMTEEELLKSYNEFLKEREL